MGWGAPIDNPPHLFMAGASCQRWLPDVEFTPRSGPDLRRFSLPNQVKIAWVIEVRPRSPASCTLATETRAAATDSQGRRSSFGMGAGAPFGIVAIRLLLLPAIRRRAQARYRADR